MASLLLLVACGEGDTDVDADVAPPAPVVDASPPADADPVDIWWGDAPNPTIRLAIFDNMWGHLGNYFPHFATTQSLDWDRVRAHYRPQIKYASSYGRFYALLAEVIATLQDGHTFIFSAKVCNSLLEDAARVLVQDRPPIFVRGRPAAGAEWLGACVTARDDDKMLVYRAEPNNPARLAPGDMILGYDGVPWRQLLRQISSRRYPVCGAPCAANSAQDAMMMRSVVLNAHLFETLDVLRYGAIKPESISTEGLLGYHSDLVCSDQMPVAGVDMPWTRQPASGQRGADVSWGIIDGTNIGYIYVYSWKPEVEPALTKAVEVLMKTDGLIIDSRFSIENDLQAGRPAVTLDSVRPALRLLFRRHITNLMFCKQRAGGSDYDKLSDCDWQHQLNVRVDRRTFYDRPIALLTGPMSHSGGDIIPYYLSQHPRAQRFGRATAGDFGGQAPLWLLSPVADDMQVMYSPFTYLDRDGTPLHRSEQTPENRVWLSLSDVISGRDSVVEAAVSWIDRSNSERKAINSR